MVRALTLACLVGAASAFMAPLPAVRRTSPRMAAELVDVETGNKPWDPWGLSTLALTYPGVKVLGGPAHPKWLKESELKHGRTAMLAFLGVLVQSTGITIPGYPVETDWTQALQKAAVANPGGIAQIFLAIGIIEGHYFCGDFWTGEGDREAGVFGFDPLGFSKGKSADAVRSLELKEVKNGRLAMIAMAAFASEHFVPGSVPLLTGKF